MALFNIMEEFVEEAMDELIKKSDCCSCYKCREDIKCIALNSLPAKYVSTRKGELFSKLSQTAKLQHTIDVNLACINAIELVKTQPHHDEE